MLGVHGGFWSPVRFALERVGFIGLAKAYDGRDDVLSLSRFLATAEKCSDQLGQPMSQTLMEFKELVAKTNPLVKRLISLRNNILAHQNELLPLRYSNGVISERSPSQQTGFPTYSEVDELFDRAFDLLNEVSGSYFDAEFEPVMTNIDDIGSILGLISDGIQFNRCRLQGSLRKT